MCGRRPFPVSSADSRFLLSCSHSRFLSHEEDSQLRGGARPGQDKREDAPPQRRAAARRYHQQQLSQQERHRRIDAEPSLSLKQSRKRVRRQENTSSRLTGGQTLLEIQLLDKLFKKASNEDVFQSFTCILYTRLLTYVLNEVNFINWCG